MLSTSTADGNYPGDSVASDNWPGFAAGTTGVCNAMAPQYFDVSGIVGLDPKPPIVWVHGTEDPIVSDTSFYDYNYLGQLGIIPDWPGAEVAPPQEMVSQTRDVLDAYRAAGGDVTEIALEGVGHCAHLEAPAEFRHAHSHRDRLRRYAGGSRHRRRRRSSSSRRTESAAPVLAPPVTESAPLT